MIQTVNDLAVSLTPNVDTAELWRLTAVLDVFVLFTCGAYLHLGYRRDVPPVLWRAGIAYAVFIGAVAVGLVANWLSPYPPTPGAKIVAAVGAVCAAYVVRATWRLATGRASTDSD